MRVIFYSGFKKRLNSTKIPDNTATSYSIDGNLRDPCTIQNPVIALQAIPIQGTPAALTYASIPVFGRYYFVKEWRWVERLWEVTLEVDVLGSFHTEIDNTTAYIERASHLASAPTIPFSDPYIIDGAYPAKSSVTLRETALLPLWTSFSESAGTYVIGIIQKTVSNSAGGSVTYYAMNRTEMYNLVSYLLSDQFFTDAGFLTTAAQGDISLTTAKATINPLQYMASCTWFPCAKTAFDIDNTPTVITIGPYTMPNTITGSYIKSSVAYTQTFYVTPPVHPDAVTRGQFLRRSPYTTYICTLPPFGQFAIDPSYIDDVYGTLKFVLNADAITGKGSLTISSTQRAPASPNDTPDVFPFMQLTAMFGVPIQLTQVATDYIGAAKHFISGASQLIGGTISTIMTLGTSAGGASLIGGGMAGIISGLESLAPTVNSEGVNGSFIAFDPNTGIKPVLTSRFVDLVPEDNEELGRPVCQVMQIGLLQGFVKCGEATVDYAAFDDEIKAIHRHLLTGFYRE